MHKSLASVAILLGLSVFSATSVSALEIVISDDGDILIYQDGVLGDSTEAKNTDLKPSPSTNISAEQKKMIRVRNSGDQKSIEMIDKDLNSKDKAAKMEAERLRLQVDAKPDFNVATPSTETRAILREATGEEAHKSLEERKARIDEKIELRRATAASKSALELRSRNARAIIPEQREVVIDPETNEVGIVLPNGEIKALNHLPDQAQEKIDAMVDNAEELELTTLEDGRVVYKTTVPQVFRMLGLFSRPVTTDVVLDDSTGEVTVEKRALNPIDRILNAISF